MRIPVQEFSSEQDEIRVYPLNYPLKKKKQTTNEQTNKKPQTFNQVQGTDLYARV